MEAVFTFSNGVKESFEVVVKPVHMEMWTKDNRENVVGNHIMVVEDDKRFLTNTDGMWYENLVLDILSDAQVVTVDGEDYSIIDVADDNPSFGRTSKDHKGNVVIVCELCG